MRVVPSTEGEGECEGEDEGQSGTVSGTAPVAAAGNLDKKLEQQLSANVQKVDALKASIKKAAGGVAMLVRPPRDTQHTVGRCGG